MSDTRHRSLWMIAVIALLAVIGYIALRPSAPAATNQPAAPSESTAVPVVTLDNPADVFTQPAPSNAEIANSGDWSMEGLNPARTRDIATPIALPLTQQRVMASATFEDGVSPPVISRGLMLVETKDALAAIDLRTGRQRWAYPHVGTYISPAIAGDTVYFRAERANEGQLVALELSSGRQRWAFTPKRLSSASNSYFGGHLTSPVIEGNTLYVGAGKELYALDAVSGRVRWEFDTQDYVTSSAAVAEGRVFVSDFEYFYAIDQQSGLLLWSYPANSAVYFSSVAAGDTVLISSGQNLIALNVADGSKRWEKNVPGESLIPAGAQGDRVFAKTTNILFALNQADGSELWSFEDINYVSLPALTQGYAFVVNGMGANASIAALDIATGESAWSQAVQKLATTAPVVAGRALYVRTTDGRVLELVS